MRFVLQTKADLFPKIPGECHASTLVALPDGGFAAAWFQGTKEGWNDVAIYGTSMEPDGRWLQPVQWAKVNALPHWNPVLFLPSQQKLLLFFKVGGPDELWHTWVQESNDSGRNWSPARELVLGAPDARGPVKNKPIRLSDGAIMAGNSLENDERWCVLTDRSTDDGATWISSAIIEQTRTPGGAEQNAQFLLAHASRRRNNQQRIASDPNRFKPEHQQAADSLQKQEPNERMQCIHGLPQPL